MYHIIINPASRSGKGMKLWKETIEPALIREQIAYAPYLSACDGNAKDLAAAITAGADSLEPIRLIVIGGDGTLNETLNGIAAPEQTVIGYIPTGSSNDFARDMRIPTDPMQALDIILHTGKPRAYDYGLLTFPDGSTHRFIGSSGIGFDAATCEAVSRSTLKVKLNKVGLGKLVYLFVALQQLFHAKADPAELYLDDKAPVPIRHLLFCSGMIHRYEGGGFMFCPDADAADGLLDLCCVDITSKPKILLALPSAFQGKHYRHKGITPYRARTFTLKTQTPHWVHTDGEVLRECSELTVSCCHHGIFIVSP